MKKDAPKSKHKEVAERVVTPKRTYFVPGHGAVEAASVKEAGRLATKRKARKDGDGNR